jgi:hypothetical protein
LGLLSFLRAICSYEDIWLKWDSKQSCSLGRKFSNDMWHATCTHVIQGHSQLFLVENQIGTLTFDLSFGHNLCFKYSNGSSEPILDIYVSIIFQWYKEIFNVMNLNPWNISLKIQDSIELPIPKMRVHLGVCGFNLYIRGSANVTPVLHFWLAHFHAFALVTRSRLRSWHHYFCLFKGNRPSLSGSTCRPCFHRILGFDHSCFYFHQDGHYIFLNVMVHVKTNIYPYQVTL